MLRILLLALAVLGLASTASAAAPAPSPAPSPVHDQRADWLARPSGADFARYYPARALNTGVSGSATIGCAVTEAGLLVDCVVVQEAPTGYGFGEAAVKLSPLFRMKPATHDGAPRRSTVRIPIRFNLAPDEGPALGAISWTHWVIIGLVAALLFLLFAFHIL